MEHSVEVTAASLFEASALALKAFRSCSFAEQIQPGEATTLTVAVKTAEVRHQVKVRQVEDWLRSSGKSPREQALKSRLRELFSAQPKDKPGAARR